jgi:hypothetical protein
VLLGEAIRDRLRELHVSQRQFVAAGFFPASSLQVVLNGQHAIRSPKREAALERGLGWVTGSVHQLRNGIDPVAIPVRTWPRADGDWKAAIDAAWEEHVTQPAERRGSVLQNGGSGSGAPDPLTIALSREIRVWLIRRDLTEVDLAAAIQMSQDEMTLRLRAQTDWTVNELLAVAEVLGVSPTVLLAGPVEGLG